MEVYFDWMGVGGRFLWVGRGEWRYILGRWWWMDMFYGWVEVVEGIFGHFLWVDGGEWRYILGKWKWVGVSGDE